MKTCYWLVIIVSTLLLITPTSDVCAKESNASNDSNSLKEENELVQKDRLDIADMYENTLMFSGKLVPDSTLTLSFEEKEDQKINIPLNSDGNFVIDFSQYTIKAGDKLIFNLTGNGEKSYEKQIEKVVLEKQVGKEVIRSGEQTLAEKNFINKTILSDIYTDTTEANGQTTVDTAIYLIHEGKMTDPIYSDPLTGKFTWVFDGNRPNQYEDEVFHFVFVSDKMMIVLEKVSLKSVKNLEIRRNEMKEATKLPDVYQGIEEYRGQTSPDTKIKVFLNNQLVAECFTDKKGFFILDEPVLSTILVGDAFKFVLIDRKEEDVFLSIEKIVLPKKELAKETESNPESEKENKLNQEQASFENNLTKPFNKKSKDKLTSLLTSQDEEFSTEESLQKSTDVKTESIQSEFNSSTDDFLATEQNSEKNQVDEINKTEKNEDGNFVILASIVLIGTVTMSGLLYKY